MPYDRERHGPRRLVGPGFRAHVHALVQKVPPGFVTTYGDLAAALGSKKIARQVGFAMAAVPAGSDLPWWRVVAAGGRISLGGAAAGRQRRHLRAEGIAVRTTHVLDFATRRFNDFAEP